MDFIPPAVRTYLYGIFGPLGLLLTYYNVVSPDVLPLWLDLVGAILLTGTTGTAVAYRPTKGKNNAQDTEQY